MGQALHYFTNLLNPQGFPPRWYCGQWDSFTGWFFILSDIAIWGAYYTIPFILIYFVRQRKDIPFPRIFLLFAAFILACGSTHLADATMFWWPAYRLTGLIYFITGVISWLTVLALIPVIPQALSLKSPKQLEKIIQERTEELKKQTADLQESEARFQSMADTAPVMIWMLSSELKTTYYNQTMVDFMQASSMEEALNKNWETQVHPEDLPQVMKVLSTAMPAHQPFRVECRFIPAGNEVRWILSTGIPRINPQGELLGYVGTMNDITDQKQMTEELEKRVVERTTQLQATNKELEAFSYSVSHDLRAPLRGINGFSRALAEEYMDKLDDRGQHYLNRILEGSQQMGKLIDDMLQLSRVTRGEMVIESVDLSLAVKEIVQELKTENPGREVEFIVEDGIVAQGDKRLLQALLQNLLDNAWKYTSKHPTARIEFGQTEHQGRAAYFVKDNGAGFEMKYYGKLFGAFQRLHGPNEFPGTGVGLATVARIIHRHGGEIWAQSQVEQGATFYFTLDPVLNEPQGTQNAKE